MMRCVQLRSSLSRSLNVTPSSLRSAMFASSSSGPMRCARDMSPDHTTSGTSAAAGVRDAHTGQRRSSSSSIHQHRASDSDIPSVVFVIGGPGTGKGTQSKLISQCLDMTHISVGELLREEEASGSADGHLINSYLKDGRIVPVALSLDLLKKRFLSSTCKATALTSTSNSTSTSHTINNNNEKRRPQKSFVVDGFPRNIDNIQGWQAAGMDKIVHVIVCVHLECPEEVLLHRLLLRGESSGRDDDQIEIIQKRFLTHVRSVAPVISFYERQGKLVHVLADKPVHEVYEEIIQQIKPFLAHYKGVQEAE
jgi:UMP-CMP kinase